MAGEQAKPFVPVEGAPDFVRPPAVELAVSCTFNPMPGLDTVRIGLMWRDHFSANFPEVEEQPPIDLPVERFEEGGGPPFRLELVSGPLRPRIWFLNPEGTELVQVQNNWFARNWRRLETEAEFPHYAQLRDEFETAFSSFLSFASENKVGDFIPTQCEVTYVNQTIAGEGWTSHGELGKILRYVQHKDEGQHLPPASLMRFAAQHIITDDAGHPLGRLYVAAEPVYRKSDGAPMFVITLTARGYPRSKDFKGVFDFLDDGHRWIVLAFLDATREEMHNRWELRK